MIRSPFLAVLALPFLFTAFLLARGFTPSHDSFSSALLCHYLFSHFSLADPPLWLPYVDWGKNLHLSLLASVPSSFLPLLPLSWIPLDWNVLGLFYLAMAVDEIVLVTGVVALAFDVLRHSASRCLAAVSAALTAIWLAELHFNFRLYFALPLCFHLVWSGCRRAEAYRLLLAGVVLAVTATFGSAIYLGVFQGLVCIVFFVATAALPGLSPRRLVANWTRKETFALAALLFAGLVPAWFLLQAGLPEILSPERGGSGLVPYETFLRYGSDPDLRHLAGLLDGLKNDRDASVYAGVLAVPLTLIGLLAGRSLRAIPFLAVAAFVFLFYLGAHSFAAPLAYHFPGMALFRHVGLVTPVIKLCLFFTAGLGLDALLAGLSDPKRARSTRRLAVGALLTCLALVGARYPKIDGESLGALLVLVSLGPAAIAIGGTAYRGARYLRALPCLLVAIAGIEGLSHRFRVTHEQAVATSPTVRRLFERRPLPWVNEREAVHLKNERYAELEASWHPGHFTAERFERCVLKGEDCGDPSLVPWVVIQSTLEPFLGIDPCLTLFRMDTATPGVKRLYRDIGVGGDLARARPNYEWQHRLHQSPAADALKPAIGCGHPKLRLFSSHDAFGGESEVFLSAKPEPRLPAIEVTAFGPSRLSVALSPPLEEDAWLYYADAHHPAWRAYADGQEIPIARANVAFKAVSLPKGTERVEWRYGSAADRALFFLLFLEMGLFYVLTLGWLVRRLIPLTVSRTASSCLTNSPTCSR